MSDRALIIPLSAPSLREEQLQLRGELEETKEQLGLLVDCLGRLLVDLDSEQEDLRHGWDTDLAAAIQIARAFLDPSRSLATSVVVRKMKERAVQQHRELIGSEEIMLDRFGEPFDTRWDR